jgi:Ca-activated chloride channel family protein
MTFTARADRRLIRPTDRSNRFVLAEITAPGSRRERGRPPVCLAFVIDRSGSMAGDKLPLAKRAVEESLARLHADDRFALVVYDDRVDVVMPVTTATAEARREALDRLARVEPRGSTNLGEGWLRGCEQVGRALADEGVNRCLLLTDGLANVGITNRDELARHAGELRARGVSTTTFGVGDDFDESLLQAMAVAGGGHFYFIASAAAIRDHVTSEVGEALDVVARGVSLQIVAPDGVRVEALSTYPTREGGGRTRVMLGDLTADEHVEVVLRLTFPYGQLGSRVGAMLSVVDRDGDVEGEPTRLAWEYADDRANDGQEREREVDRAVARAFAARARQEAVALNRVGDYDAARAALGRVARRIRRYTGRDAELRQIVAELEEEADRMAAPMVEESRKELYFASANQLRSRAYDGKAIKLQQIQRQLGRFDR